MQVKTYVWILTFILSMSFASADLLFYENAGTINTTRWDNTVDGDWVADTTFPCNGTSFRDPSTGASQLKSKTAWFNSSGYNNLNITFTFATNALDAGEWFRFQVGNSSTSAQFLTNTANIGCTRVSYSLTNFANQQSILLNFTCLHNAGANERCVFDDIYMLGDVIDTSPPVISNVVNDSVSYSSARINWTTDDLSNSSVKYGTSLSLTSRQGSSSLQTFRTINLSGLTYDTFYYYNVTSCNSGGYCTESGTYNFTTEKYGVVKAVIKTTDFSVVPGVPFNISGNVSCLTDACGVLTPVLRFNISSELPLTTFPSGSFNLLNITAFEYGGYASAGSPTVISGDASLISDGDLNTNMTIQVLSAQTYTLDLNFTGGRNNYVEISYDLIFDTSAGLTTLQSYNYGTESYDNLFSSSDNEGVFNKNLSIHSKYIHNLTNLIMLRLVIDDGIARNNISIKEIALKYNSSIPEVDYAASPLFWLLSYSGSQGFSYLVDINVSSAETSNDTDNIRMSYSPGADTCTYSGSGDWVITDNCIITSNTDLLDNKLILNCPNYVVVTGSIYNVALDRTIGTCRRTVSGSGFIR